VKLLFPEAKERENRFKLALRMGLPVFALASVSVTSLLMRYFKSVPNAFIIVALILLGVMIYYLFYLIYQGFNERITDPVSHAFSREFFVELMQKELKKRNYTLMLFSIVNLGDINKRYGFANGDKVLYDAVKRITEFLGERKLTRVPIAHFQGGDFIVALEGKQEQYNALMDLMCAKLQHYSLEEIEVDIIGSMTDSVRSKSPDKVIEWLYELQSENQKMLQEIDEEIDQDTIEGVVADAVRAQSFSYRYQAAYEDGRPLLYEMAVKLVTAEGKLVHQKRFMPVIARLGLLRRFDEIQTEAALSEVPQLGPGQKIAVNIAPSSLRNALFFERIMMLLYGDPQLKDRLVFVISESSYFHQTARFNARLQAFRQAGICIALDRIGGLHTTLRYLQELDVDIVRIETSLGKAITDVRSGALLKGLLQAAGTLGYRSWIRMVEDETQYAAAREMGIDIIQGNYLSPITTIQGAKDEIR